ncbi:MAG: hypothetical protein WBE40_03470 [Thermoplasmata archaeon]
MGRAMLLVGAMTRRFTRLRAVVPPGAEDVWTVPQDGLCLNVFLVLRSTRHPDRVLLGRLDPTAPWEELSALGPDRLARLAGHWLLPASQLLFFESPDDAARRIAREQLETELPSLGVPRIFSEAYSRPAPEGRDPHWDIHFVYPLPWPGAETVRAKPWKELAFLDARRIPRPDFGRNHGDILDLLGPPAPEPRRG